MIPLPALLAEIRAAGPCPEPEGERMTLAVIDRLIHRNWKMEATAMSLTLHDVAAKLATSAVDAMLLVESVVEVLAASPVVTVDGMWQRPDGSTVRVSLSVDYDPEPPDAR